ncbi:metacaspase [Armillaria nabsnona]|nr:metacaspase [Armillaria nabsnona]
MQSPQSNNRGSCESSGCKRALCIGIDYRHQRIELQGCIKDAKSMVKFLTEHGYQAQDITMLTDEMDDKPTKENILNALSSLVKGAQKNDSLFLHYSGHGGQVPDKNDDEDDGEDEDIECFDSSVIIDDDIHKILQSLPSGCRLTALFDSCHSGTILDLPYAYNCIGRRYGTESKLRISADVVCWSGARDNQLGADTPRGGAMTCAFIESLQDKPMQSYKELLHSIRTIVGCKKGNQTPQLGSSHPIDANRQFIF